MPKRVVVQRVESPTSKTLMKVRIKAKEIVCNVMLEWNAGEWATQCPGEGGIGELQSQRMSHATAMNPHFSITQCNILAQEEVLAKENSYV